VVLNLNNDEQTDVSRTLTILAEQLATKDAQIAEKDVQISAYLSQIAVLNEQLKEANQLYRNNPVLSGNQEPNR